MQDAENGINRVQEQDLSTNPVRLTKRVHFAALKAQAAAAEHGRKPTVGQIIDRWFSKSLGEQDQAVKGNAVAGDRPSGRTVELPPSPTHEKLDFILRSGNNEAISAVVQNIEVFYKYVGGDGTFNAPKKSHPHPTHPNRKPKGSHPRPRT